MPTIRENGGGTTYRFGADGTATIESVATSMRAAFDPVVRSVEAVASEVKRATREQATQNERVSRYLESAASAARTNRVVGEMLTSGANAGGPFTEAPPSRGSDPRLPRSPGAMDSPDFQSRLEHFKNYSFRDLNTDIRNRGVEFIQNHPAHDTLGRRLAQDQHGYWRVAAGQHGAGQFVKETDVTKFARGDKIRGIGKNLLEGDVGGALGRIGGVPLVNAAGGALAAVALGRKAWGFARDQQAQNAEWQRTTGYGGTDALRERLNEKVFQIRQGLSFGMSPGEATKLFEGVRSMGLTGDSRRAAQDFGVAAFDKHRLKMDEVLGYLSTSVNIGAQSFSTLAQSIDLVSETAKHAGANVGEAQKLFGQIYGQVSHGVTGSAAPAIAAGLTNSSTGLGRVFKNMGIPDYFSNPRMMAGMAAALGMNPAQFSSVVAGGGEKGINMATRGIDAFNRQRLPAIAGGDKKLAKVIATATAILQKDSPGWKPGMELHQSQIDLLNQEMAGKTYELFGYGPQELANILNANYQGLNVDAAHATGYFVTKAMGSGNETKDIKKAYGGGRLQQFKGIGNGYSKDIHVRKGETHEDALGNKTTDPTNTSVGGRTERVIKSLLDDKGSRGTAFKNLLSTLKIKPTVQGVTEAVAGLGNIAQWKIALLRQVLKTGNISPMITKLISQGDINHRFVVTVGGKQRDVDAYELFTFFYDQAISGRAMAVKDDVATTIAKLTEGEIDTSVNVTSDDAKPDKKVGYDKVEGGASGQPTDVHHSKNIGDVGREYKPGEGKGGKDSRVILEMSDQMKNFIKLSADGTVYYTDAAGNVQPVPPAAPGRTP